MPKNPQWRDLNHNGIKDPYEDPELTSDQRADDLLSRLSLEEKVGLLFQTAIETGPGGTLVEGPGVTTKTATTTLVTGKLMNHFNVHGIGSVREAVRWSNALQQLALQTPHGIPVTVSTDPRHAFHENVGASFSAGCFSQWPEPLGLAALGEGAIAQFADIARQEYVAVGIRAALHPTADLATEPRWARQQQTFGNDPARVTRAVAAYLRGFQLDRLGSASVACTTKHFPGGGPQRDGEDAHFPYGREQVYPGGRFADHLQPFLTAIELGTAGIMPYYGMPVGLEIDGTPVEEVGFGYNRQIVTELLRDQLGYDGIVLTDWELVTDKTVGDQELPARAWGVEDLIPIERVLRLIEAGADQLGGEECTDLLLDLVKAGQIPESRIDVSARRLLLQKFQLGLFDDPFVSEHTAEVVVNSDVFRQAGFRAQAESVTVLTNREVHGKPLLPLSGDRLRIYVEGVDPDAIAPLGSVVQTPREADVAIVRIAAPWEERDDLFLEKYFHQGSLEFPPGRVTRLARIAAQVPLILDVAIDRPAILTPLLPFVSALTVTYGSGSHAYLSAISGHIEPKGQLPFDLPSSMASVRDSLPDVPNDTDSPLFAIGYGLGYQPPTEQPQPTVQAGVQ